MTGVAGLIVKVSVWLPVPPALVALIVTVYVPASRRAGDNPVLVFTVKLAATGCVVTGQLLVAVMV
jgi:hypothetical protein